MKTKKDMTNKEIEKIVVKYLQDEFIEESCLKAVMAREGCIGCMAQEIVSAIRNPINRRPS